MPRYSQSNALLTVTTPHSEDVPVLSGFRGHEAVLQLFSFQLELLAELESEIRFDRLVGRNAAVQLRVPAGEKRQFYGLVTRFSQGAPDEIFVHFAPNWSPVCDC